MCSMSFSGQFEIPVDKFIFQRYFPDPNINGIFVECGAFDGVSESSCKFFEESMNWKGYNIEPYPLAFERLTINRPLSSNHNFALSDNDGSAALTIVNHPRFGWNCNNTSLTHTKAHMDLLIQEGCDFSTLKVKTRTWRSFIETTGIKHVDLFVLDVEGHELQVIEGMCDCPVLPDIICVEFGHSGREPIMQALSKLGERGYVYDISSYANSFFVKQEKLSLFNLRALAANRQLLDTISMRLAHDVREQLQGIALEFTEQLNVLQHQHALTRHGLCNSCGRIILKMFRKLKNLRSPLCM
jgi:FkbM family methyltransferase